MQARRATELEIEGMTCGSCVRHVGAALRGLDGVTAVDVDLRAGRALVRHDGRQAPVRVLIEALAAAGYPARASEEDEPPAEDGALSGARVPPAT